MIKWLLVAVLAVSTVNSARIDCVYKAREFSTDYICKATVSHTGVPMLEHVTGTQQPGKHLKDVNVLNISNQTLAALPKGIAGFFKNLREIAVDNVPLTTISASDLEGMTKLKIFSLLDVKLTSLPGDLFAFTPNVIQIVIRADFLAHIGPNLLSSLATLDNLDIISPCVTNQTLPYNGLSDDLSAACPPLSGPGSTTTTPPTTCACDQKIENLLAKVQQLKDHEKEDIKKVEDEAKAVAKRLKALEKHLGAFCNSLANVF